MCYQRKKTDSGNDVIKSLNNHSLLNVDCFSTLKCDETDVISVTLSGFDGGLFVDMSDDQSFQFYHWKDIAANTGLKVL